MNDKLKQSLDGRLGGMRWGEREQAEVFRQIRRKELQDVKHVKRGSGMLAIAMALLFIVMGAAYALTTHPRTEDVHVASQTPEPVFVPVSLAHLETDYFILTVDSASATAEGAELTATVRVKDPRQYMLRLDRHMPPGDTARTPLLLGPSAAVSTTLPGGMMMACGNLTTLDVMQMTEDSAVFRMTGSASGMGEEAAITLWVAWTDPADGSEHTETLTCALHAAYQQILLAQGPFLTATLGECGPGEINVDLTPSKPWYTLNRQEEGKTTLTVHGESMAFYHSTFPDEVLGMVDGREPAVCEMAAAFTLTADGLRMQLTGEIPAGYDVLYGYIALSVHTGVDGVRYEEILVPVPMDAVRDGAAAVTSTPTPAPVAAVAPTPSPQPAAITGAELDENELLTVYMENGWYDGFSAEATLRFRAHAPAIRLTSLPNQADTPDENTWIIRYAADDSADALKTTVTFSQDEATGDVLAHIVYEDPHASLLADPAAFHNRNLTLLMTFEAMNEKTWASHHNDLRIVLPVSGDYAAQPLHLLRGSASELFVQGGLLTTDRYHYIGVMLNVDAQHVPSGKLLDASGSVLATGRSVSVTGSSLKRFPRRLFPYDGTDNAQFDLIVFRVEKSIALPQELPIQLEKWTQEGYVPLAEMTLSAAPIQPSPTPTPSPAPTATPRPLPVSSRIGLAEIVSVYLDSSWSDGFTTEATLRMRANDPAHRLAITPNAGGMPDASTWVVQLTGPEKVPGSENEPVITDIRLELDAATGDVLAHVTCVDLIDLYQDGMLDLTLTTTNELTWERYSVPFRPVMKVSGKLRPQPLYALGSTADGLFLQGATLTTSRYRYIGVMLDPVAGADLEAALALDAPAQVLRSGAYTTYGMGLQSFPKALFPYEGDGKAEVILHVMRIDRGADLPDPLLLRLTGPDADVLLPLSATEPREIALFDTPLLTAALIRSDFAEGHAAGQLQIRLKDPLRYTLDPDEANDGKVCIRLEPALLAYNGEGLAQEYLGDCTIMTDTKPDACTVTFYGCFPGWQGVDAADPRCVALLAARADDGSFKEDLTTSFAFPRTGSISLSPVGLAADVPPEGFSLDAGLLIRTDYLNVLSLRWTGEANMGMLRSGSEPAGLRPTITYTRGEAPEATGTQQNHYFLQAYDPQAVYSVPVFLPGCAESVLCPLRVNPD